MSFLWEGAAFPLVFNVLQTLADSYSFLKTGSGRCHRRKTFSCPRSFSDEVILLGIWSLAWVWTLALGLCWLVCAMDSLAMRPLALRCSLCFYYLWSFHSQKTPGFLSTKDIFLKLVYPESTQDSKYSCLFLPALFPHLLRVCWKGGYQAGGREGQWIWRFALASCLGG